MQFSAKILTRMENTTRRFIEIKNLFKSKINLSNLLLKFWKNLLGDYVGIIQNWREGLPYIPNQAKFWIYLDNFQSYGFGRLLLKNVENLGLFCVWLNLFISLLLLELYKLLLHRGKGKTFFFRNLYNLVPKLAPEWKIYPRG